MTDPLRLAEKIERSATYTSTHAPCAHIAYTFSVGESRLLAAALRLAEASLAWEDTEPQTPDDVVRLGLAFDAYRAAREAT